MFAKTPALAALGTAWLTAGCAPGAQSVGRYAVTAEPIRVGLGDPGLCIAVDPRDPKGIWWWQPGASGCATRSTGPDVFPANEPKVSRTPAGAAAEFQLGTHDLTRPYIHVRLGLGASTMRSNDTGHEVALGHRADLKVPFELPAPRVSTRIGLDHIPLAVRDLEAAQATYRALGFSLKPGRPHENGIRNAHIKFPNGAGLELLTVPAAVDPLSTQYVEMIRAGEGPAFLAFHDRDLPSLHAALKAGGFVFHDRGGLVDLETPGLGYLFWVGDNRSPTDRPEHFAHANGAIGLAAVWIATDDGEALRRLLVTLGGRCERKQVLAPDAVDALVVTLDEGEVVILPASRQLLPGRPIVGASFRVSDLGSTRGALGKAGIVPRRATSGADRIVVAPKDTHGLWIEFRPSR